MVKILKLMALIVYTKATKIVQPLLILNQPLILYSRLSNILTSKLLLRRSLMFSVQF